MKTRQNNHIPFFRHDLFGVFAQHLSIREIARLKQTCELANHNGMGYEQRIFNNPDLLLRYMSKMSKQTLSRFLQHTYHPESPYYQQMQTFASQTPKNLPALACFSLMADAEWIATHQADLCAASIYTRELVLSDCLQQSLEFMLHPNVDLRTRILMHKGAFYNLRRFSNVGNKEMGEIDLSWANFSEAEVPHYIFINANLNGASFRNANLTGALFNGANLREANLCGANLTEAHLNVWLHRIRGHHPDAKDIPAADVRGAKYNSDTRLPAFFARKNDLVMVMPHPEPPQPVARKNRFCVIL